MRKAHHLESRIPINEDICRRAVAEYKCKWSKKEGVDIRVLNEWEHKVNECIRRRIQLLREKHINRRKQHVLKSRKHLNYLHELQSKYVLVPADKAANNIIVVCKKYYLEVVLKELRMTSTYKHVDRECMDVVTEHLKFMTKYKIYVDRDLRYIYHHFIGYQNYTNSLMVPGSLLPQISVVQSLCPSYLLHA